METKVAYPLKATQLTNLVTWHCEHNKKKNNLGLFNELSYYYFFKFREI